MAAPLVAALLLQLFVPAALAAPLALRGEEVHCFGGRAHLVRFDVAGEPSDGSSLKGVEHALVSLEPSPAHVDRCGTGLRGEPSGDKEFCYGVNQDSSCSAAQKVLPLKDGFECKDCFVSASADAYYKLNYSWTQLNSVELGLRDIHLRASAGIHKHLATSDAPLKGTMELPGSDQTVTLINTFVGCPVCVKVTIKVGVPTSLDYGLAYTGDADFEAGASLDVHLGDNLVRYDHGAGWTHQTSQPQVGVTHKLSVSSRAEATLTLGVRSSLTVGVDDIVWYHLNLDPTLPLKLTYSGGSLFSPHAKVCVDGDASFKMEQEADLDWNFMSWHEKDHWGPNQLYSWSKQGVIHACKEMGGPNSSALVI